MANLRYWIGLYSLLALSLTASGAPMTKFDWQAGDSGPENYPMQIIGGDLRYHTGSGSLYVPNKATLHNGWGIARSSHIVGPDLKPLPDRLDITFFSYTENQFYSGTFTLPYDKILKLFQEGYDSYTEKKRITYNQITVGIAPGGAVAVWLSGINKTTEVFFGQAEKVDLDWGRLTSATRVSREEYVRLEIEDSLKTPEAIAALKKNGVPIGLWARYRTRYNWQPFFTNMPVRDGLIPLVTYFNGEADYLRYPLNGSIVNSTRAVPSRLDFTWMPPGAAKGRALELYFNETEILDAFKKLSANNQLLKLEMRLTVINNKNDFTVWLHNDKEAIELKHTQLKSYAT